MPAAAVASLYSGILAANVVPRQRLCACRDNEATDFGDFEHLHRVAAGSVGCRGTGAPEFWNFCLEYRAAARLVCCRGTGASDFVWLDEGAS